ncbi:CopG family transcriptional regulator [Granulicatella sp. zg-ZJ]|uniref:type II toxin-antitoxin system RelB family antitoxin n=1 Tax=Granulicatella sp. zg-ZJ TaxID=2678504 RepID=UPI0013D1229F|nr:DUF6290 family protein [Granulicatella sp. zg-ZJ]MBS4749600.1 CopG family transcriptional regulator [Carnobacteriaceae bacterium zg-ZUI78]NEW62970.1 CopG family transcriptional regulator [Granulicatella sp. zg-ZJ]
METSMKTSIQFSPDVLEFLKILSQEANMTVSNYIQRIVIERLEDDFDIELADKEVSEWRKNGSKVLSMDEMMKKYG